MTIKEINVTASAAKLALEKVRSDPDAAYPIGSALGQFDRYANTGLTPEEIVRMRDEREQLRVLVMAMIGTINDSGWKIDCNACPVKDDTCWAFNTCAGSIAAWLEEIA